MGGEPKVCGHCGGKIFFIDSVEEQHVCRNCYTPYPIQIYPACNQCGCTARFQNDEGAWICHMCGCDPDSKREISRVIAVYCPECNYMNWFDVRQEERWDCIVCGAECPVP